MAIDRKQRRFLLSSFALGAFSAFVAAGFLDYHYFQRAVEARDMEARRAHRDALAQIRERLNEKLFDDVQAAREREEAAVHGRIMAMSAQLRSALKVADARQKQLEIKNRELHELTALQGQFATVHPGQDHSRTQGQRMGRFQTPSERAAHGSSGGASRRTGGGPLITQASMTTESWDRAEMRAEFARQIAAEAAARKKPKGPVYLNTPQGRVILVPAEDKQPSPRAGRSN